MLSNAYLLAKIGVDTAENEQRFAEILPKDAGGVALGLLRRPKNFAFFGKFRQNFRRRNLQFPRGVQNLSRTTFSKNTGVWTESTQIPTPT